MPALSVNCACCSAVLEADPIPAHRKNWSLKLQVPPLGALILEPARY